jgi:hypothetical protein
MPHVSFEGGHTTTIRIMQEQALITIKSATAPSHQNTSNTRSAIVAGCAGFGFRKTWSRLKSVLRSQKAGARSTPKMVVRLQLFSVLDRITSDYVDLDIIPFWGVIQTEPQFLFHDSERYRAGILM